MARKPAAPTPDPAAAPAAATRPIDVVVRAPAGPRRRAGLAFGKSPRVLTAADLGPDPDAVVAALSADPRLVVTVDAGGDAP